MDAAVMSSPNLQSTPMDSLYLALVQCFVVILCGYIAGRFQLITKPEANGLNTFVGTFSLPALIFLSMAKLDFSTVNFKFLLAVLISKSLIFFLVLIISIVSTKPSNYGRSALFAIFTTQSNDFAIGYPMINALYASTHPEYAAYLYLLAPISLVALNPIGFIFLEVAKRRNSNRDGEGSGNALEMLKGIIRGITLNPILVMTVLGIIGNLIFSHKLPALIEVVLEVLGNAFSASALFLLGLMMVGKIHKLKGAALVIPGILISIKLLVLPLVIRESVIILNAGENASDTSDLSTFGFLYGTIPTAPALFIFTLRYNMDIDLIASAMVVCTFLSAPLMFLSAKVISAVSPANYTKELEAFSFDTSAASVAACIWLLVCFLLIKRKKLENPTHRCTFCLVLAQLMSGIGVLIWTRLGVHGNVGSVLWYIQFTMITIGVYASRFWTAAIALTLLFSSSHTDAFVKNFQKYLYFICWGGPFVIVSIMCLVVSPAAKQSELENPNFQFGRLHVAVTILVLLFCFFVTLGSLVLRQRYQHGSDTDSSSYSSLIPTVTESNGGVGRPTSARSVVDVEDLISPENPVGPSNDCYNNCDRTCEESDDDEREIQNDPQIIRHLVLLILLLCSMFIGIAMSVATLIMEEASGIYTELAFLDVALGFGQSLMAFAIFGLDPGLGKIGCWLRRLLSSTRHWKIEEELRLPNENDLSPEARAFREQFERCYLANCQARIGACRTANSVRTFTGSDLVNWLLEAGVARNRKEAIYYGRSLLDSRVLNHVDNTRHFYDQGLLYQFRA